MKKTTTLALAGIIAIGAMSFDILSGNGKSGKTTTGCGSCHGANATPTVTITLSYNPSITPGYYLPNTTYTVTATVANTGELKAGIDLAASAGTLAAGSNTKILNAEIVQTGTGNITSTGSVDLDFVWTSPASGTVTFNYAAIAANNNAATSGDFWNIGTTTLALSGVGIAENTISNFNLSVFPNPASDNMNVKFILKETSSVSVDLFNINGNKVANLISENGMKGDINKIFNVSSYSKGIYFLQIKNEKSSFLKKIIIE